MLSFRRHPRALLYRLKSGVLGITRLLANEWAAHGINVNAIAPGYMATNNTQQLRDDEQRSRKSLTAFLPGVGAYRKICRARWCFGLRRLRLRERPYRRRLAGALTRFVTKSYTVTSFAYCIKPYTV